MKLYVIGPVTGREDLNRKAFEDAKERLWDAGYDVLIPHDVVLPIATHERAMLLSVKTMLGCDGVAALTDWDESRGAKLEREVAVACGIEIHCVDTWLRMADDSPESDNLPEETEGKASDGVPDATPHGIGVELPRDAEGREISLDTEVLYAKDGTEVEALGFVYTYIRGEEPFWHAKGDGCLFYPSRMHLTPPDSWDKLLADLDRGAEGSYTYPHNAICSYVGSEDKWCGDCELNKADKHCVPMALKDIADRIRKLRGDDA